MAYDLTDRAIFPLSDLIDFADSPLTEFLATDAVTEIFDSLYYTEAESYFIGDNFVLDVHLALEIEFALKMPGMDAIALVLGDSSGAWTSIPIKIVIGPDASACLYDIPVIARVDRSLLKPMKSKTEPDDSKNCTEIQLGLVTLSIDSDGFQIEVEAEAVLPLCMIGDSGVIIEAGIVRWLTPDSSTVPETAPSGFTGIYIDDTQVHLPDIDFLPPTVRFDDCFIGTGGFTGRVSFPSEIEWDATKNEFKGDMVGELFGFKCGLKNIEIAFVQSCLQKGSVVGEIFLPYLEKRVGIELNLSMSGDFSVAITGPQSKNPDTGVEMRTDGLLKLRKEGVIEALLDSVVFEKRGEIVFVRLSGQVTPLLFKDKLDWPTFEVKELSIDSKGNVRLDGGWLNLREQKPMNFYGFQVEITKLGFGKTEDGGKWIGFSGGVKLVEALSAGASVEGLRIVWYDDPNKSPIVTFKGVGVEFEVPDVLKFKGAIAYREPYEIEVPGFPQKEIVKRFDGQIKLKLMAINMEIDAKLVIGSASGPRGDYTFFAIYVGVELPAGIPLWSTGLALYGMAGLFATQMAPNKRPEEGWYENPDGGNGWYKRDEPGVTDLAKKWDPDLGSLAFGVGATIGTLPDNGNSFHGKLLLLIILPGPIVMLEGRGNLLKKRADPDKPGATKVTDEPLFRALAVLDNRAGTFTVGLDAQYKFKDKGELIDIRGSAEAFFSFSDAKAWHLYVGRKDPRESRIRALIFNLFKANAYFMLDARALAMGAWVGYDGQWKFGPLSVTLEAWLEGNAVLSWKPAHFYGDLWLHGKFGVAVFGFGLTLTADAKLAADVFDPFHLLLSLKIGLDLPWPLPDLNVDITKEWGPDPVPPPLPLPLKEIAVEHLKVTTSWLLPRGALLLPNYDNDNDDFLNPPSGDTQPANLPADVPVVPLDARPHLTFGRHMNDDALVGVNIQPGDGVWEQIGDPDQNQGPVKVRYGLKGLALHKWKNQTREWQLVARKGTTGVPADDMAVVPELFGSWAPVPALSSGDASVYQTKLWLWSKNPFDYSRHAGRAWDEWFISQYPDYPCVPPPSDREVCCEVAGLDPNKLGVSSWQCPDHPEIEVSWVAPDGSINPNEMTIKLPPGAKGVKVTPSQEAWKTVRTCVDFRTYPSGTGPNPRIERGAQFTVFNKTITNITGKGLACGNRLEIILPRPCSIVTMFLTNQAVPTSVEAFNSDGSTAGVPVQVPLRPFQQPVEMEGTAITRIVLVAAGGETLLHELCFEYFIVTATGKHKRGNVYLPSRNNGMIEITGTDLTSIHVSGESPAQIEKVCVTLPPDPVEIIRREEMNKHLVDEMARWSQVEEVMEPDTIYRLKVLTKLQVESNQQLDGYTKQDNVYRLLRDPEQTEYAYFRTKGPPGLTKLLPPLNHPNPDKFDSGLDDLVHYVRQTVPATVPSEGKPPLLPRPVYRAYDVGVVFNENYVDLMYRMSRRDLGLYLYNSNNQPVRDAQGRLIVLSNRWGTVEKLTLTESEERWVQVVNDSTCVKLDEQKIPRNKTLTSAAEGQVLDADTVYEARLVPLLLHEDFAAYTVGTGVNGPNGILNGWTIKDEGTNNAPSRWEVGQTGAPPSYYIAQTSNISGGSNDGKDPVKLGTMLLHGEANWTDYRLSALLRATTNDDAMGVVFRHQDPNTYYRFSMDRERKYRRLVKVINGAHTILAEDDFVYRQNVDYLITVEAIGDSLRVYQDGVLVFAVADNAIANGRIGLYCWGNAGVRFSDMRVDDFHKNAPVPYRFKLTTSQFTNFLHHLQSYQDETWPATVPATANVAEPLSKVVTPTTPPSEDEARAYETLAKLVLESQANQNPSEVQVTRVRHNSQELGFLIQSPEPIDWKRTELKVLHADRWVPAPQLPEVVKLTEVTFGENAPNEESVTLLLREAMNLTGYHIEQRQLPGPLTESGNPPALFVDDFNGADSGVLFREEFGPNALDHYVIVNEEAPTMFGPSAWTVIDGHIVQTGNYVGGSSSEAQPDKPGTIALAGSSSWSNMRINAVLRSEDRDDIGIVFRYQDAQNYFRFSMSRFGNYRRLIKKSGGVVKVLWEDAVLYNLSQSYHLVIENYGDRLLGYLDDVLLFSLQDSDIDAGRVGLYCWRNTGAHFEALQIESLESNPVLWQPTFADMSELEIVDEPGTAGGPSNWSVNNGVLTQSSNIHADSWQQLPGNAHNIAVDIHGLIWIIGGNLMSRTIYRWNGSNWDGIMGNPGGVKIAVGRDGNPWVIDSRRLIVAWNGLQWNVFPIEIEAYDIAIESGGIVYIVGTPPSIVPVGTPVSRKPDVYFWDGSFLQTLDASAAGIAIGPASRIVIGPGGNPWVVDDTNRIFRREDAGWQQLPGSAHDIGIGADGSIWIVGTDPIPGGFRVYRWNSIDWEELQGLGAVGVAADAEGNPWIVDDAEGISKWSGSIYHKPGAHALGGDSDWKDVQISVRLHSDTDEAIGMVFRCIDVDNYYCFSMNRQGNYRRLIKKVGGKVSKLWEGQFQYSVGKPYELTIRAVGEWLSVYLDGILLLTVPDKDIERGRVGFYCHANTGAHFERVLAKGYTRRVGQWTIRDEVQTGEPSLWCLARGELSQISQMSGGAAPAFPGTKVVTGEPAWTNYRLMARMRSDTEEAIGVIFRYVDDENYYRLSVDAKTQKRMLTKKVNGVFTLLSEKPGGFKVSESFILTVDAVGPQLVAYMDDERIFEVTDNAHLAGQVGLYCWSNNAAHFEKVEVRQPVLEASALLRDRFVEGDLGGWSFVEEGTVDRPANWKIVDGVLRQSSNIHTPTSSSDPLRAPGTLSVVGDTRWADVMVSVRLESSTGSAIGVLFRYRDANNYYRFSMDRLKGYRRLVKNVGGNFALLWEDNIAYEVSRAYELTIVATGNVLRGYIDGVPIFVVEDNSHAAGCMSLYCWANTDARFSDARVYPADRAFNDWLLDEPFDVEIPGRWTFLDEGGQPISSRWKVTGSELQQTPSTDDTVWVEDTLPAGARALGNAESWNWIGANPAPFSGASAHQSNLVAGMHQHYFDSATDTLTIKAEDTLFAYVYLDPTNPPTEVMLQWNDGTWNHRAYWGANNIAWGIDGTENRRHMGPLPVAGQWVRLEVPAKQVGLEGKTLNGMAFTLFDGRATWDCAGKASRTGGAVGTYAVGGDPIWMDYRFTARLLVDNANGAIGAVFRYQDDKNYYRFLIDHNLGSGHLVKKTAGVESELWKGAIKYTLGRTYALTIDCVGSRLTGYLNGVQIFVWEDDDHTTGRIGLCCWTNTWARFAEVRVAAPVWVMHYSFNNEKRMPAGTRVRVYAGNVKDASSNKEPGIVERFCASYGETGRLRWPKDGVDLRVRASGAGAGHARRFLLDRAYSEVDANKLGLLRKADGTGFFLTNAPTTPGIFLLVAGQYRLIMTYHRNNQAADQSSQVFSEAGNSDSEKVTIDIPWQTH